MMRTGKYLVLLGVWLAIAGTADAQTITIEDVKTPRGETVRVLIERAENPVATVVLFAGGNGGLSISEYGNIGRLGGNFLIRSNDNFVAGGANTAIVDAPSDRSNVTGFRSTEDHAQDIGAVVRHLKVTLKRPVWVVGTSNGTTSAANAGVRLTGDVRPNGVVLTATRFTSNAWGTSVLDLEVERIHGPVLIVHHRDDSCRNTLPDDVPDLKAALKNAGPVKVMMVEGGTGIRGNPCQAFHYHGFAGIEAQVVADIMVWIRNPAP